MFYFNLTLILCLTLFSFYSKGQTDQTSTFNKNSGGHGLIFEKDSATRLDDSSYTDVIQLISLNQKTQAIQFRLSFNNANDDSTILIFDDIQKGSDLSDPSWLLDFNVIKGEILKNGASNDEVFVVLYNLNQDGGLMPGNYTNFIKVNYKTAKVGSSDNKLESSINITHAEASTSKGFAVDIAPSRTEFNIYIESKK